MRGICEPKRSIPSERNVSVRTEPTTTTIAHPARRAT
nr:MAG TPA: hypothetical protein [Caudoviricetes sp.]